MRLHACIRLETMKPGDVNHFCLLSLGALIPRSLTTEAAVIKCICRKFRYPRKDNQIL